MFSTSEDAQYIGGVQYIEGCHEYIGDIMCTSGISCVHRGVFSASGGYHECIGGYIRGSSFYRRDIMMHVREQVGKNLSISIENPDVLNIPRCDHDISSMYS